MSFLIVVAIIIVVVGGLFEELNKSFPEFMTILKWLAAITIILLFLKLIWAILTSF